MMSNGAVFRVRALVVVLCWAIVWNCCVSDVVVLWVAAGAGSDVVLSCVPADVDPVSVAAPSWGTPASNDHVLTESARLVLCSCACCGARCGMPIHICISCVPAALVGGAAVALLGMIPIINPIGSPPIELEDADEVEDIVDGIVCNGIQGE